MTYVGPKKPKSDPTVNGDSEEYPKSPIYQEKKIIKNGLKNKIKNERVTWVLFVIIWGNQSVHTYAN